MSAPSRNLAVSVAECEEILAWGRTLAPLAGQDMRLFRRLTAGVEVLRDPDAELDAYWLSRGEAAILFRWYAQVPAASRTEAGRDIARRLADCVEGPPEEETQAPPRPGRRAIDPLDAAQEKDGPADRRHRHSRGRSRDFDPEDVADGKDPADGPDSRPFTDDDSPRPWEADPDAWKRDTEFDDDDSPL